MRQKPVGEPAATAALNFGTPRRRVHFAGEDRAHQVCNSWTGQVAAARDAEPAILDAYRRCCFYVFKGVPAPKRVR